MTSKIFLFIFFLGALTSKASNDSIYCRSDAPEAARYAAGELQRLVFRSTGRRLTIVGSGPSRPFIRLVEDDSLPPDGFEIRVEDGAFVIAGNDAVPVGMWAVPSHGTLWGACEFAERILGVRWLFPGELGEDVPQIRDLPVELSEPIRSHPGFAVRSIAYLGEGERGGRYPAVIEWMKHQRLTNALHPFAASYGHSWDDYIKPSDMEAHPEWKSSNADAVRNGRVQFFCTTAPGLVELFAKRVIESIDRNPAREMSSISPTDGGGFCACDRCRPLLETDPHGKTSHAGALLLFYKRVAEIVAAERPGHRLGGFVYYNYAYPPANAPRLPDNLSLCWAPLNYYGYGLFKPLYRAEFAQVLQRWSGVAPHLFYHNYSTWMRSFHGAPLPMGLDILRRELPAAAAISAWGARMVGSSAWGVNAPVNYILARQLWNPQLDVSATLDDWLQRAYGPGWRHMRALYDDLDARMLSHKEAQSPLYKGSQYEVNEEVMKAVYAPAFPAMESRYHATLAKCDTIRQRQRLGMFGNNLIQLHYALRKAGLVGGHVQSFFHRDDGAFEKFMEEVRCTFSLYEDKYGQNHGPVWKGEWSAPPNP